VSKLQNIYLIISNKHSWV